MPVFSSLVEIKFYKMKNLKIVFASLLLAVMGVVGFSSFTTAGKKALSTKVYKFTSLGWEEGTPTGCGGQANYCGVTFDDEDLTIEQIEGNLPTVQQIQSNSHREILPGVFADFTLKN